MSTPDQPRNQVLFKTGCLACKIVFNDIGTSQCCSLLLYTYMWRRVPTWNMQMVTMKWNKVTTDFRGHHSIPPEFPQVLKDFVREVLREQPENIYNFGARYFSELNNQVPVFCTCSRAHTNVLWHPHARKLPCVDKDTEHAVNTYTQQSRQFWCYKDISVCVCVFMCVCVLCVRVLDFYAPSAFCRHHCAAT